MDSRYLRSFLVLFLVCSFFHLSFQAEKEAKDDQAAVESCELTTKFDTLNNGALKAISSPRSASQMLLGLVFAYFTAIAWAMYIVPNTPPGIDYFKAIDPVLFGKVSQRIINGDDSPDDLFSDKLGYEGRVVFAAIEKSGTGNYTAFNSTLGIAPVNASISGSFSSNHTMSQGVVTNLMINAWLQNNSKISAYAQITHGLSHSGPKALISNFMLEGPEFLWTVAFFPLGALISSLVMPILPSSISITKRLMASNLLLAVGAICSGLSPGWGCLAASRLIFGTGAGIASALVPPFCDGLIGEKPRGLVKFFSKCYPLAIPLAVLLSSLLREFFLLSAPWAWRAFNVLPFLLASSSFIYLWLVEKPATESRTNVKTSEPLIDNKPAAPTAKAILNALFCGDGIKTTIVVILLHILQQGSFICGLFYYQAQVFGQMPLIGLLLSGANIIGTVCGILGFERFNMKWIGVVSGFGCCTSFVGLALGIARDIHFVKTISGGAFILFFASGFAPIPWLLPSKISPKAHASAICSIGSVVNWLFNFGLTVLTGRIFDTFGASMAFGMFSGFCFLFGLLMLLFVPEIHGTSYDFLPLTVFAKDLCSHRET